MLRACRWVCFGLSLAVLPALAPAQVAKVAKTATVDVDKVRAKLLTSPYIEGKLTKIGAEDQRFGFLHTHQTKTVNADAQKKLTVLYAQFTAALQKRSTSLEELKKMQADGMALEKAAYTWETTPIPLTFQGDAKLVVRTLLPPTGPDGKPKRLTPAEEKKLKGDTRLPGYQAELKDLDMKAFVRIYLDKAKPKPPAGTKPEDAVYAISMIVIAPEPPPTVGAPGATAFKIPGE